MSYVVMVKSTVEISPNFVAFSEYMNFKQKQPNKCRVVKQFSYSILVSTYALAKKYIDIPKD